MSISIRPEQSDSKKNNDNSDSNTTRRKVLKTFVVGAGSITFVKANGVIAQTEALPPIVNLLLDDDGCGTELEFGPVSAATNQIVSIPSCATQADITVFGAGGAGSTTAQFTNAAVEVFLSGADGGNGGIAYGRFDITQLSQLKVRVGEGGASASEAQESGSAGEFGGGMGGGSNSISMDEFGRAASAGGSGGGYSAVFAEPTDNELSDIL